MLVVIPGKAADSPIYSLVIRRGAVHARQHRSSAQYTVTDWFVRWLDLLSVIFSRRPWTSHVYKKTLNSFFPPQSPGVVRTQTAGSLVRKLQ